MDERNLKHGKLLARIFWQKIKGFAFNDVKRNDVLSGRVENFRVLASKGIERTNLGL